MTEPRIPSTDETVPALDLTHSFDDHPLPTGPDHHGRRRTRRLAASAVALALVAGIAGAVVLGGGSSSDPSAAADPGRPAVVAGVGSTSTSAPGVITEAQPEPQPQPEPEPEPQPPAEPGILAVSKHAIHLADGVYHGSFSVRNNGGSPIDWHWLAGDYGIAVSAEDGTLAPGEQVEVSFTINPFQVPEGDFLFANCIFNDDVAVDVWIDGYRKAIVVNPDIPQGPQVFKP